MEQVHAAQKKWGDSLVEVGACDAAAVQECAAKFVDTVYGYANNKVLFKPTVAFKTGGNRHNFRLTREGAISYMVGGSKEYPEDKGFALKPWKKVRFDNADINLRGGTALAMGDMYLTDAEGIEIRVAFSFGYTQDADAEDLKVVLHHSSIPYSPPAKDITKEQVEAAQKKWGDGLIEVGACGAAAVQECAAKFVDSVYGYAKGYNVLFKPTIAFKTGENRHNFRFTREGAISYMVGGNKEYPEDKGLALKPWKKIRFDNGNINLQREYALAMGDMYLTDAEGVEVRFAYSFGYNQDAEGDLKIVLHHGSIPYKPQDEK